MKTLRVVSCKTTLRKLFKSCQETFLIMILLKKPIKRGKIYVCHMSYMYFSFMSHWFLLKCMPSSNDSNVKNHEKRCPKTARSQAKKGISYIELHVFLFTRVSISICLPPPPGLSKWNWICKTTQKIALFSETKLSLLLNTIETSLSASFNTFFS